MKKNPAITASRRQADPIAGKAEAREAYERASRKASTERLLKITEEMLRPGLTAEQRGELLGLLGSKRKDISAADLDALDDVVRRGRDGLKTTDAADRRKARGSLAVFEARLKDVLAALDQVPRSAWSQISCCAESGAAQDGTQEDRPGREPVAAFFDMGHALLRAVQKLAYEMDVATPRGRQADTRRVQFADEVLRAVASSEIRLSLGHDSPAATVLAFALEAAGIELEDPFDLLRQVKAYRTYWNQWAAARDPEAWSRVGPLTERLRRPGKKGRRTG